MHNMTRPVEHAAATAFANKTFQFKNDRVTLLQQDGQRFMNIESPRFGNRRFQVTKVIGGHHREDFAGIERNPHPTNAAQMASANLERVLPVSFILSSQKFRYKGYSVMSPERPGLRPGAVWSRTCIFCHNTVPYFSTLLGTLAGPNTPPYQGEVVDALLPEDRRQQFVITNEAALRAAVLNEIAFLRGENSSATSVLQDRSLFELLPLSVQKTRHLFAEKHLIEIGIGCESCHGGSVEHVRNSAIRPSYTPRSDFLRVDPVAQNHAQQQNRICARCHQVLFTRYPYTWEGGERRSHPGGSNINSGEARDLLLGGCTSQLGCVACHDPHAPEQENEQRMATLQTDAGNAVCLRCHQKYSTAAALREHSHHDPAGPGARCMNCHMPKKNMSLDTRLTRYHRIGSPTEPVRVTQDRPLECALCHADRTVEFLVSAMERMYQKSYNREALRGLYGDLQNNVMMATLQRGKPHEQVVAIATLGQARRKDAVPLLAQELVHPLPIVRYYAVAALEQILGSVAPFDLHQENDRIQAAARDWIGETAALSPKSTQTEMIAPAPSASDED